MKANSDSLQTSPDSLIDFSAPTVEAPKPEPNKAEIYYANHLTSTEDNSDLPNNSRYLPMSSKRPKSSCDTTSINTPHDLSEKSEASALNVLNDSYELEDGLRIPIHDPEELSMI